MQKIIRGVHTFCTVTFNKQKDLYSKLSRGQEPAAMFITCADSRVVPNVLTETDAGDLFVIRNAGNLIPKFGSGSSGESASIEYAVLGLKIPDIIVCGHTDCGAIKFLMSTTRPDLPLVREWVEGAAELIDYSRKEDGSVDENLLSWAYRQNVILQVRNLLSYPFIVDEMSKGNLRIHGWLFDIASGQILECDMATGTFRPLVSSTKAM